MKREAGFTLFEMLVAMAVGGVLLAGLVTGIFQVLYGVEQIKVKSIAIADIENAAHWITRDVVMGQSVSLVDGAPPVSQMSLSWTDYTEWAKQEPSASHSANYTYSGTQLVRGYDGVEMVIGRYLTRVEFSRSGNRITVTLTSSPEGDPRTEVTRTYRLLMRGQ
jgi:prepilin-type N-terminal cleavage/methylation domain-containing protein